MNICLIGNGLTNLVLAKLLASKNIRVTMLFESKKTNNFNSRSIGITKKNYDYLNKEVINLKKISWPISNIEVFKENSLNKKIFNFSNKEKKLFFIFKYNKIYNLIKDNLKKNKKIKIIKKNKILYNNLINSSFDLIINSDSSNDISKKLFFRKIFKDYKSNAFTTVIKHQKIRNNIASQIFTDYGPLAFLPLSNTETSIVFSILKDKYNFNEKIVKKLILKYNKKFKIKSFSSFGEFNLKYLILRKYYYKNILSFGDSIHKIHPLSGQGFNMVLRDINIFSDLIQEKLDLGLTLNSSVLKKFESMTKHKNYLFSSGIDFIHEFFKFENKYGNEYSTNFLSLIGKNNLFKKYTSKIANQGLTF